MKVRATSLGRTKGRNDNHTPIKEEDVEDDFEEVDSHASKPNSKQTGGTSNIVIEEANNYDSNGSRTQSSGGLNFGLANSLNIGQSQSTKPNGEKLKTT